MRRDQDTHKHVGASIARLSTQEGLSCPMALLQTRRYRGVPPFKATALIMRVARAVSSTPQLRELPDCFSRALSSKVIIQVTISLACRTLISKQAPFISGTFSTAHPAAANMKYALSARCRQRSLCQLHSRRVRASPALLVPVSTPAADMYVFVAKLVAAHAR